MSAVAKKVEFDNEKAAGIADDLATINAALALLAKSQFTLDQLFYQLAARRISSGKSLD